MTFLKTLWNLLAALPSLVKLLGTIQERIDEEGTKRRVSEDVKKIHEAFDEKDPKKLNDLFRAE